MIDTQKTKTQLIAELVALRQQVAQLEDHRSLVGGDTARLAHEVLNTLHQHTAVVRADGIIVTVNAAWDEFTLKNSPEANPDLALIATGVGTDYFAVCRRAAEANASGACEALTGMLAVLNGERPTFEMEYPCDSPTESRWFLLQVLPLSQSPVQHLLIMHTNITVRKQTELALRASEERYRGVFETIADFAYIVQVRPDGAREPEWVTPVTSRITGYPPAAMLDTGIWQQITYPDDWPIVQKQIDELLANRSASVEYRIVNASGEVRWVLDHAQPEWNAAAQRVIRIYGALQDITERKRAEEALRTSEDMYRLLAENSSDVISLIDAAGKIVYASPALIRRLGYDADEVLSLDTLGILQRVHPDDRDRIAAEIKRGRELQLPISRYEYRARTKHGNYLWLEDVLHREFDEHGQFIRTIINSRDVTERKRAEQDLELLAQAGRELSTTLNLHTIYSALHLIVRRVMPCDFVFVSRFSADDQLIRCVYGNGSQGEFDVNGFPPIPLEAEGRGTQSLVIRSGEPLLLNDYAAYLQTANTAYYVTESGELETDGREEDGPPRAALIVPLKVEGRVVGVVQVLSIHPGAYTPRDLQFLESLALHVATALTNAHLLAQVQTELAERRRTEATLRESEEKFSRAFQYAPTLMTISDLEDGRYLEVNDEFVRVSGYSRAEAVGKTSIELGWLSPRDRAQLVATLRDQGRVTSMELTLLAKDRHPVICLYHGELITVNGQMRLLSIAQDITARKQVEAAQRASDSRYRVLFETLSEGVALNEVIYNDHGEMVDYRILEVNPAFYTTAQYDSPVVGQLATQLYQLPADYIKAFWLQHKDQHAIQYSEMTSPVSNHQFLVATSPFVNDLFVTSFFDITDRIQAEAARRESEHKFRSFIEQAAVGISLTDEDGHILEWNDTLAQISGVARAAALGHFAWDVQAQLVPPDRREQYSSAVLRDLWLDFVQQCVSAQTTEAPLYHPDRGLRTVEETIFPIVTQRGRMIGQIVRDLTEQRRLEERYRLLFEQANDAIFIENDDDTILDANQRACELLGYTREELLTLKLTDIQPPEVRGQPGQTTRTELREHANRPFETIDLRRDGTRVPVEVSVSPLHSGDRPLIMSIVRDISQRKQAERQLRLQSAALEAAANGIIITDRTGNIEWTNVAFLALTGYTSEEVIGHNPRDLIRSGKQSREFYRELWDTITGGQVWRGEIVNRRKDGRLFVEETAITPVRLGGDDRITHFIAIKQDITARKQVDLALRQYAERLQTLHEIDRGVAVAQSPHETAQTALQHLHRLVPGDQVSVMLFDRAAQQMVVLAAFREQPFEELNEARFPVTESALEPLLHNQLVLVNDTAEDSAPISGPLSRNLLANGVRSYITTPLMVENQLIGVLNVSALKPQTFEQDHLDIVRELSLQLAIAIHQARLREQIQQHTAELEERVTQRTRQLAEANARLQDLDSLKSKFVSEVSHELRTPVTSLTLYLSLLEHGKSDKHAHYLSQANQQAARMKQLIEDILDLSRLERDKSDLTLTPIDLNAVLEQAVVAQLPRATAVGLNVTVELMANLSAAHGDINRLLQVATNLIANAINYTPAGEVRIRSFQHTARVGFEVQDTGMGIAPEDLPHLFQRFYRGQRASQSSVRGTGLGLSIVKEIIDWHGGEVEVHSEVGVGSTFTVWLPMAT